MTAREMIEQEFSGKLGPQSMFEPDGNIRPGVVFAAERVIDRLMRERDAEVERLRNLLDRTDCAVEAAMPHGATYPSCILCGGEIAHVDDCIITEIRKELHKEVRP